MMDEHDFLIATAQKIAPLNEEEQRMVRRSFHLRKFQKNEIFLHAGSRCNKLFFVSSGIIRTFHTTEKGREFTRVFVIEGQFCTMLSSFTENVPSPASFQAVEATEVLEIGFEDFKTFIENSAAAKKIYMNILEGYQNYQIQRIELLTQNTPKQRVEMFHKNNLHLIGRLSNRMISSYLQITPETYSRCVKNLR